MFKLIFVGLLVAVQLRVTQGESCQKVVCYTTNWSQYRPGDGKFFPENINPNLCTHIIYAFAKLDGNHLAAFEWNDDSTEWSVGLFQRFVNLKQTNPTLKTLLAVGGWNLGSEPFTRIVQSPSNRQEFIRQSISFLRQRGFDGLDLDWEYPANRGSPPEDRDFFTNLVREMKAAFESEARTTGKPRLLLTAAVAAGKSTIDTAYDIPTISQDLDFINVMTYDLHGSWETVTGHNSPLYPRSDETGDDRYLNLDFAAQYWIQKGAPRDKIVIGVGFYGRSFTLASPYNYGVGASAPQAGRAGQYTREAGFVSYYEVCDLKNSGGIVEYIEEQRVPYIHKDTQWIGFDDQNSLREKVRYIKQNHFGGVMVWALPLDDFTGTHCGKGSYPLLHAIIDECQHTTGLLETAAPTRTTISTSPANSFTTQASQIITTVKTPSSEHTILDCSKHPDGFYPSTRSCQEYYICVLGYTYTAECASGLVFNPNTNYCDWPYNYHCTDGELPSVSTTISVPAVETTYHQQQTTHGPIHTTQGPILTTQEPVYTTNGLIPTTQEPTTNFLSTSAVATEQPTPYDVQTTDEPCRKVVCYTTNWSQYRPGDGKFFPENINPNLCTHIIYAFAKLDGNHLAAFEWNDDNTDWSVGLFERLIRLKQRNPAVKILLAVGGWNLGSEPFTRIVQSPSNRHEFTTQSISFLRQRGFDGLDLDWEYPANRGSPPEDRDYFTDLVREMKMAFENEARTTGKPRLLLTAAVAAGKATVDTAYNIPAISQDLDFINVMTYDLHGSWETVTGHNSPLYPRSDETGEDRYLNLDFAAQYWVQKGAPRDKIVIGLGLYGRSFTLASAYNNGLGAPAPQAGRAGQYTREGGFLSYYEVCDIKNNGGVVEYIEEQRVPYIHQDTQWIGFDDQNSLREKVRYVKQNHFGGVMVWALPLDDFTGTHCGHGSYPLLHAITDECQHTTGLLEIAVPEQTTVATSHMTQDPSMTQVPHITSTVKAPEHDQTEVFDCSQHPDGFYPSPRSCQEYFLCASGYAYAVECAHGLVFNPNTGYCDWPYNYHCTLGEITSVTSLASTTYQEQHQTTYAPQQTTQAPHESTHATQQTVHESSPTTQQVFSTTMDTEQPTPYDNIEEPCRKVVCYTTNWSQYRPGDGKFFPENINPNLCTHIIYAFAKLDGNHLAAFEWNDDSTEWSVGLFQRLINLKQRNPAVKILLAVGGWNLGSEPFTRIVQSPSNRHEFTTQSISFLRQRGFDGLDLDWEYPANRGSPPEDRDYFTDLVREMKMAFENEARTTGKPRLLLTAAVAAGKATIDTAYNIPAISRDLDFINVMTYDLHGSWETVTGHNSPLYPRSDETGEDRYLNLDFATQYWVQMGAPRDKLVVGLGLYGRSFTLASPSVSGLSAPAPQAGRAGQYTREAGFLSYYEVCDLKNSGGSVEYIEEQRVPYIHKDTQWIGFDDQNSLREKVRYVKQNHFGGVMVWALPLDDFTGTHCGHGSYPLLHAIIDECQHTTGLLETAAPARTTVATTAGPGYTSLTPPPSTTAKAPTHDHTEVFDCIHHPDGFYPSPRSCHEYFICVSGVTYTAECVQGLVFNPNTGYCDWPYNYHCIVGQTSTAATTVSIPEVESTQSHGHHPTEEVMQTTHESFSTNEQPTPYEIKTEEPTIISTQTEQTPTGQGHEKTTEIHISTTAAHLSTLATATASSSEPCRKVVCYTTNWSQYRPGDGKFFPENINPNLCTHIIYAFAKLDGNHLAAFEWNDDNTDWSVGLFERLIRLKQRNPAVKILLAVGGWNLGSEPFTRIVQSPSNRHEFTTQSISFLRQRGFDGLDLDWEYPANRGSPPEDRDYFTDLVREMRAAFEDESRLTGQPRLLLTAAVAAGKTTIDTAYDIPAITRDLDFINLMTYDLHGSWETVTGHNSPLYPRSDETGDDRYLNLDFAAQYWVQRGAPRDKLIVGLGLYGRSFTLASAYNTGLGAPAPQAGRAGLYTREGGFLSYYEVCDLKNSGGIVEYIEEQRVPYIYKDTQWIGFDDQNSLREKVRYVKQNHFGGVMVWALPLDDFTGTHCGKGSYPLLHAIIDECQHTTGLLETAAPEKTTLAATLGTGSHSTSGSQITSTIKAPTHDHTEVFDCIHHPDGFYPSPRSCHEYFICVSGVTYTAECAQVLVFNPNTGYCDWPYNYHCTVGQTSSVTTVETTHSDQHETTFEPSETTQELFTTTVIDQTTPDEIKSTEEMTTVGLSHQTPATPVTTNDESLLTTSIEEARPSPYILHRIDDTNTFDCTNQTDGFYGSVTSCTEYVICALGIAYLAVCPGDLIYNTHTGYCDHSTNFQCQVTAGPNFTTSPIWTTSEMEPVSTEVTTSRGPTTTESHHDTTQVISTSDCTNLPNGFYGSLTSCKGYIICASGITYHSDCPGDLIYNTDTGYCDHPTNFQCQINATTTPETTISVQPSPTAPHHDTTHGHLSPPTCIGRPDGYYGSDRACDEYVICTAGSGVIEHCTNGLVYNTDANICDWPSNFQCTITRVAGEISSSGDSTPQPRQDGFDWHGFCENMTDGVHADPSDCGYFYECSNTYTYRVPCAPGSVFNPEAMSCDSPHNVPACRHYADVTDSTLHQTGDAQDLTNFCIDRTDGIYADPTNCAAFIQCSDYYTYHQECAPGSVFNPSLEVCDNHDLVPECDHVAGD